MAEQDDLTEEEQEQLNKLQEQTNLGTDNYGYPIPPTKESVFKFFKELLNLKDSSKIGNLKESELGTPPVSVRGYQSIAQYCDAMGLDLVGTYFKKEAEIILATSDSRKGFLAQLFVTQIKKEQKVKSVTKAKDGWFNKNKGED